MLAPLPGIEPTGNMVKKRAEFTVETRSAGQGEVLVYVEDPAGHQEEVGSPAGRAGPAWPLQMSHSEQRLFPLQAKVTANNDKNRTFSVWYVPEVTGTHKVSPQLIGRLVTPGRAQRAPALLSRPASSGDR